MPSRQLICGNFAPALETALADAVRAHKTARGPLAPLTILAPSHLLGLHLRRKLAEILDNGHINVRFQTLDDFARDCTPKASLRIAPRLGLELLVERIVREKIPADGYFAPVRDAKGFHTALLETFKDLKQSAIAPAAFSKKANTKKLREIAAAYSEFCNWLAKNQWFDESDALELAAKSYAPQKNSPIFLYGFYDLTAVQRHFVEKIAPEIVFFPWDDTNFESAEFQRHWFLKRGWQQAEIAVEGRASARPLLISAPDESREVREALRAALKFVRETGKTFNDVAILSRSREPYDAILRDAAANLDVKLYFRGGRPLTELPDAKLFLLLLDVVRTDFSRASVMELACHIGPHSHWDALSVQLGIVGGRPQWLKRAKNHTELAKFLQKLFSATEKIPQKVSRWSDFVAQTLDAFQKLGGQNATVIKTAQALADLDAFSSSVSLENFAEFCAKAFEKNAEQTEKFQSGGIFVGDVMAARGLSWPFVIVLGMVEKNFPRVVREDPILLDAERKKISGDLPLKLRGFDEERLLFALATASAREKLALSFPRWERGTTRPRVPSFLLLDFFGCADFAALEKRVTRGDAEPALDERELDLAALKTLAAAEKSVAREYVREISPILPVGLDAQRQRWGKRELTPHDGLFISEAALKRLRARFGLENLVTSATALEKFSFCPFYYFQKYVLKIEPWQEPEQAMSIEPLALGALYHKILEEFFRQQRDGGAPSLRNVAENVMKRFEDEGVTGFPTAWEIQKEIIHEELAAFLDSQRRNASEGWTPREFEKDFDDLKIEIGGGPIRLRGKIDRIDVSADGARARVMDYKTGKFRDERDNELCGGETLQLPLYILAAEKLHGGARVERARYAFLTVRGRYRTVNFTREALENRAPDLKRILEITSAMIRDGVFAQYAAKNRCEHCEFRPICGNGIYKLYERKKNDARVAEFHAMKESVE
jgi:ATP-dependent helicase/nuclease subunit B